jgi:hypothetical protein
VRGNSGETEGRRGFNGLREGGAVGTRTREQIAERSTGDWGGGGGVAESSG